MVDGWMDVWVGSWNRLGGWAGEGQCADGWGGWGSRGGMGWGRMGWVEWGGVGWGGVGWGGRAAHGVEEGREDAEAKGRDQEDDARHEQLHLMG